MRGRHAVLAPRSATGQDGDALPAAPHQGGWPPTQRNCTPNTPLHPAAGVKGALHHKGEPPRLPPGEPHTWLTKDPMDTTGVGPSGEWQSPFPTSFPLRTVFMYVCKIRPPCPGQLCLGGWCPCPHPCPRTGHSLAAPMPRSCPPSQHLVPRQPRSPGPNPAPKMGARCPLVSTGHRQHRGPGFREGRRRPSCAPSSTGGCRTPPAPARGGEPSLLVLRARGCFSHITPG